MCQRNYFFTEDTLARAPQEQLTSGDAQLSEEINIYVQAVMSNLPATDAHLEQIRDHQQEDEVCRQLISYIEEGWPPRPHLRGSLNPYWAYRANRNVADGLLLYGSRLVIPSSLRFEILNRLHEGHQGITKCRLRAQQSV